MHKVVAMADLYPILYETLHAGGIVSLTSTGTSMLPMLKHQRDSITLEPITSPLLVNEVVLYRRDSGQFVLHRIVGRESNGGYVLCGDNQIVFEHNIEYRQIIGRLQAFTRKGRYFTKESLPYKVYVGLVPALRLLKRWISFGRRHLSTIKHWICREPHGNR